MAESLVLKAFDRQVEINKHLGVRLTQARQQKALLAKEHAGKVQTLEQELTRLSSLLHSRSESFSHSGTLGLGGGGDDNSELGLSVLEEKSTGTESRWSSGRRLKQTPQTPPRDLLLRVSPAPVRASPTSGGTRVDHVHCKAALLAVMAERDSLAMRLHAHAKDMASLQNKFELVYQVSMYAYMYVYIYVCMYACLYES